MHPSGMAKKHIERQIACDEGNDQEPDNLTIAAIFALLSISEALTGIEQQIHQSFSTGMLSVEVRND